MDAVEGLLFVIFSQVYGPAVELSGEDLPSLLLLLDGTLAVLHSFGAE